ncbi:hypothetical protein [Micromonospora sp. NPDC050276]|uniref:hypothetical protein n=1 Tax=Micromonospora sp. NPDC050276 TaxID=3364278 RepID=UPI00378ACE43
MGVEATGDGDGIAGLGRRVGVAGGLGVGAGTDRVLVGTAVAVEPLVGVAVGPDVGSSVGVGSSVKVGLGSGSAEPVGSGSVGSGSAEPVGSGSGSGGSVGPVGSGSGGSVGSGSFGDPVGDGEATGGGTGGEVPRVGFGATGGVVSRRTVPGSLAAGPSRACRGAGAAGNQPLIGTTLGVLGGGSGGWLVIGSGITTGPTDGPGMNGVLLSGRAVLPGVAEPALIAARMGIDAVPANNATVSR